MHGLAALTTLNIVDWEFYPTTLIWMLEFPRGLEFLSTNSDSDNNVISLEKEIDYGAYFQAI